MAAVDIIIPVFNGAKKLQRCLEAISVQTFTDYAVIVVDDGSTDDVAGVIERSSVAPTRLIRQPNLGAAAARNRGAKEGSAPYILFCDADCILNLNLISTQLNTLRQHPQATYVYSNFKWGWKTFRPGEFSADRLRHEPYINTHSLLRRDHFPGFDESLNRFQDWDLWLTMLKQGHTGVWIDEILFTVQPGGTMSTWLPSFTYKLLPWLPAVREYHDAMAVIVKKHGLEIL